MADEVITRRDLVVRLTNVKWKRFVKAAEKLGFEITQPKGGSSHFAIRKKGFDQSNINGLVITVYKGLLNCDKPKVIKALITKGGCDEDDVWEALGML
ncbi:hypothetical protein KTR10_01410 [Candidatus Kaiserbacteria bacterium]|nr:hypothetical protein [Candidatus Kaiserbacteria bacterium]